jgi:hypothetical protein
VVGIAYVIMQLVGVVLMLMAGNPPSFDDAKKYAQFIASGNSLFLGDAVLTGVATLLLIVFVIGVGGVIRSAGEEWDWAAALAYGATLVVGAIAFTGAALEATTAIVSTTGSDAGLVRTLWAVTNVLFTFIYLPSALLLTTVSYAALRTRVLPIWAGWLGIVCGLLNLAALVTVFGGTGSYGAVGLAPLILGFAPAGLWILGVSVALLNLAPATTTRAAEMARSL